MNQHLGDRVAAFVDGELGHEARDRALAHLAHCLECRHEVDTERLVKSRLAGAAQPMPSADLMAKLIDLGAAGPPAPAERRRAPVTARPQRASVAPAGGRPKNAPAGRPGRGPGGHRRLRYAAMGVLSLAAVTLSTSFAVGGGVGVQGAPVTPAVNRYGVEHANTANMVPLTDPALDAYPAIDPASGPAADAATPDVSPGAAAPSPSAASTVAPLLAGVHTR